MPTYRYKLSSGESFTAPGDTCADVRQAILDQLGASLATCGGGDTVVNATTAIRYLNPTTGAVINTAYTVSTKTLVPDPPMQWGSVPHLLQASLIAACVFALLMGIKAGDRL